MAEVYNEPLSSLLTAAGYLEPEIQKQPSSQQIETAYQRVEGDPRFSHGARRRDPKLSLEAKRRIVEIYETLAGVKLL